MIMPPIRRANMFTLEKKFQNLVNNNVNVYVASDEA